MIHAPRPTLPNTPRVLRAYRHGYGTGDIAALYGLPRADVRAIIAAERRRQWRKDVELRKDRA